ncbi:ubiquitin fusion degradation protein UFD1 family protein [Tieghemostelium lacteum]|uniref:Ubiquitin fusion degradation protein UFD1 family protein n=1 Tax=Tieghemostelium lacteum TaxID=361077 RepID=A0A151ZEU2_TIELA|nr:ubiquitin fusion degradation protein UFD1 family protein [Tieghemostelium lacteum]|eukprot:KYQ92445.1 ubiquitin fusion degradation protein UFD1 family protein [Tieghemostelium lacteum]
MERVGFCQKFKAFPINSKRQGLEAGGKILLPPSALNTLSRLNIQYPMLFRISNFELERTSHCGVLEFTAEEGICYLPYWMMQNLLLESGDIIEVKNVSLLKGTFVKIQPHTSNFLEISNPKAVLENSLRKFATLTKGDEIMIDYNNNKYYLSVTEIKPNNSSNAISIIEADVEVDFAAPKDYKEEPKNTTTTNNNSGTGLTFGTASKPIPGSNKKRTDDSDDSDSEDETPKFKAFTGSGARLDGKLGTSPKPTMLGTSPKPIMGTSPKPGSLSTSPRPLTFNNTSPTNTTSSNNSNNNNSGGESKEGDKFKAFQGKGYSLK